MNWPSKPISSFCLTGSGGTPHRGEATYFGGDIPWVKSGELREDVILDSKEKITQAAVNETNASVLPPGTILLAMYGATVGRIARLGVPAATNQAVCHIIPNPEIADPQYLFYALRQKAPELIARRVGGAQPNISQKIVRATNIPLPPLAGQRRIAAILDTADAVRRKRRESVELLEEFLRSVFLEMFGDPVRNEKGWEVSPLEAVTKTVIDYRGKTPPNAESGVPVISAANINDGRLDFSRARYISHETYSKWATRGFPQPGDVLITTEAPVGDVAPYPSEGVYQLTRRVIAVRPDSRRVTSSFLLNVMRSTNWRRRLESVCHGSTVPRVLKPDIMGQLVPCAPLEQQRRFDQAVSRIEVLERHCHSALSQSTELFAALAQRAFRGEL